MSLELKNVSQDVEEEGLGSLRGCLVEGDAGQRSRERHVRRRALAISIVLQCAVLAALILLPLFGKPQRIAYAYATPVPPYSPYRNATHNSGARRPHPNGRQDPGHFFHDSIVWINRVSSGAGVHHVGVKNDAGDERFTSGADNARRVPQKPIRQADVPVAIINPDRGILGRKYAEQAALDRHADLAGGAAGRKAVDVFMMVEINVGPLAIKPGPTFDIAVQRNAPNGMSFNEFLPSYNNPR